MRRTWPLALAIAVLGFASSPPGPTGSVKVTVLGAGGTPQSATMVTVLGTAMGAITNASGVAVLSSVPAGIRTFRAVRIGFAICFQRTVDVPADASIAITISCDDAVEVPNAPGSPLIALLDLATGPAGSENCSDDLLLQGTGRIVIPGNAKLASGTGTPCHGAALLLATDRAPLYVNASLPWSDAMGDVFSPIMAPGKLNVAIRIIISDPTLTAPQKTDLENEIRDVHLSLAAQVLDESYAGIRLVDDEASTAEPQIVVDPSVSTLLAGGCLSAAAIRANASIYNDKRINVYYVQSVTGEDGSTGKAGYTCGTSDAPNIIFVDDLEHLSYTLAHEIGHALGLDRPDWGHSQDYEGFYVSSDGRKLNVMAETDDLPADVRYLSVGQVSEMHLSDISWLNRKIPIGGSTVRSRQPVGAFPTVATSCSCPETHASSDCAALKTDISRVGTAQGPATWKMPCIVNAPATATLCANKTLMMDATFLTWDSLPTISGTALWVSLDPSVLTAQATGKTMNITHGKLKGVSAGTATVRVYVDGSFAPIVVTVMPPC